MNLTELLTSKKDIIATVINYREAGWTGQVKGYANGNAQYVDLHFNGPANKFYLHWKIEQVQSIREIISMQTAVDEYNTILKQIKEGELKS
jgi:hypothetical protein